MADNQQIINLYTELAQNPNKDFGWEKGLENAKAHGYKQAWIDALPTEVWEYCAAVGNPFQNANIKEGDTVLDLGCGAGVDVLVSRLHVGVSGNVVGVDITPKMVEKAREHAKLARFDNVQILESGFDDIAIEDESVDVVISNGAINLTSCKESVFSEIYRVLKPDGKLYFADMIDISIDDGACCSVEKSACCIKDNNTDKDVEEDWANCVAGTLRQNELIEIIEKAGFADVACTGFTHYTTSETTQGATFHASKIPATQRREKHWDSIFKTKDYTQVFWHQSSPSRSLNLIQTYTKKEDAIIDVGCGASLLIDALLNEGYQDITLLDTSHTCLDIVKERLTSTVTPSYICSDILTFETHKLYTLWHDRAVFHFLLTKKERERYFKVLEESLVDGGFAIISTFAPHGELSCAGLETRAYDKERMLTELPETLQLVAYDKFTHITPKNTAQAYSVFVMKKC